MPLQSGMQAGQGQAEESRSADTGTGGEAMKNFLATIGAFFAIMVILGAVYPETYAVHFGRCVSQPATSR